MLEKNQNLRKIEIMASDGKVNETCHLEYQLSIMEDGQQISRTTHRENMGITEALEMISSMEVNPQNGSEPND